MPLVEPAAPGECRTRPFVSILFLKSICIYSRRLLTDAVAMKIVAIRSSWLIATSIGLLTSACGDDLETPIEENPNEVITTVTLTFMPQGGGGEVKAGFQDPDGDGGAAPTISGARLAAGTTYTVTVEFRNELANPTEDVTPEILEEQDEHQIFIVGDTVEGPATNVTVGALIRHRYLDMDSMDLPIGLQNSVEALTAGTGSFSLGLRHMPLINGQAQKVPGLADVVRAGGGFSSENSGTTLPGSWDVVIDVPLTVE